MAFGTVIYNASSGSDTAASGSNGPSTAVTGTDGDIATSTITLNETADLTGSSVGDVVWYDGNAGDRHLFTVASFTGGVGSCTAIVVDQVATATRTASNWAVGGLRQTPDNDTANADIEDWEAGWVYEYQAGTYTYATATTPVTLPSVQGTLALGGATMKAASGASPVIAWTEEANLFVGGANTDLECVGLSIQNTTAVGANARAFSGGSSGPTLRLLNCTILCSGICVWLNGPWDVYALGCDFRSTTTDAISITGRSRSLFINCIFHNCGRDGIRKSTTASLTHTVVIGCIFRDNAGAGMIANSASTFTLDLVKNCVFHDNTGAGLEFNGTTNLDYLAHVLNNIFTDNGGYGITSSTSDNSAMLGFYEDHNAFRGNTSGETNNITQGANDVTLTADPYTSAAGDDYTLNATAGGGAACTDAGYGYDG